MAKRKRRYEMNAHARNSLLNLGFSEPFDPAKIAKITTTQLLQEPSVGWGTIEEIRKWLAQDPKLKTIRETKKETRARAMLAKLKAKYAQKQPASRKEINRRTRNALTYLGFSEPFQADEIAKVSLVELLCTPNCGYGTVDEIERWLFQNGKLKTTRALEKEKRERTKLAKLKAKYERQK